MAKLYAPFLESTLPARYGDSFSIPFQPNRLNSINDITGMKILIKQVKGNLTKTANSTSSIEDIKNNIATFNFSDFNSFLKIGSYYKVQLAYMYKENEEDEENKEGYYSNVGIMKWTNRPLLTIETAMSGEINESREYIGVYSNSDITEKVYSYCFEIRDANNNVYETTGELIHDNSSDQVLGESYDIFRPKKWLKWLEENESYTLHYKIKTINNISCETNVNIIPVTRTTSLNTNASLEAKLNRENAYIKISVNNIFRQEKNFTVLRKDNKTNVWYRILDIKPGIEAIGDTYNWSWKDYAIEHGLIYQYAIVPEGEIYVDTEKGDKISSEIYASFEHMYLFDDERQLKIKYNPKMSTYKENVLEQKIETIGSKYPFVYRNGNVRYKEFALGGLLSYLADEEELFMTLQELGLENNEELYRSSTKSEVQISLGNTADYVITAETRYKNKVLEFLNNGKNKVLKTPTEGNFIVRLMNISLSPEEQLGRMIHNFSATVYEIAEYNFEDIINIENGLIIQPPYKELTKTIKWQNNRNVRTVIARWQPEEQFTSCIIKNISPLDEIYINGQLINFSGVVFYYKDYQGMTIQLVLNIEESQPEITVTYRG